jgi:hypothetical protein
VDGVGELGSSSDFGRANKLRTPAPSLTGGMDSAQSRA